MTATLPLPEPRPRGAYIKMQCQMPLLEDTDSVTWGEAQGPTLSRRAAANSTLRKTFSQHS